MELKPDKDSLNAIYAILKDAGIVASLFLACSIGLVFAWLWPAVLTVPSPWYQIVFFATVFFGVLTIVYVVRGIIRERSVVNDPTLVLDEQEILEEYWSKITISVQLERPEIAEFKCKLRVYLENNAGCPVVIIPTGFVPLKLRVDPGMKRFPGTKRYVTYLYSQATTRHDLLCISIKPREKIDTWVGIDPKHIDSEIRNALDRREAATLFFTCCWLDPLPVCDAVSRNI